MENETDKSRIIIKGETWRECNDFAENVLHISMRTFRRYELAGRTPPVIRLGRTKYIHEQDALEWLRNGATPKRPVGRPRKKVGRTQAGHEHERPPS